MKRLTTLLATAILALNVSAQTPRAGVAGTRPASQSILKGMKAVQHSASAKAKSYKTGYISRKSAKDDVATVTLNVVGDPCGDGSGFNMIIDADATIAGEYVEVWADAYGMCEYKIPEDATADLSNLSVVLDAEVSVDIPGGAYDFIICNPAPSYGMIFYARWAETFTGAAGDDFNFLAGYEYVFTIEEMDFVIYEPEHDAKLTEIVLPAASPDLTTQEDVKVRLLNSGTQSFSSVQLSYAVDGGAPVTETCTITLAAGEETLYTFATKADFSGLDAHTVVAEVIYDMDMNPMNNTITGFIESPAPDILFAGLLTPASGCEMGSDAQLVVRQRRRPCRLG